MAWIVGQIYLSELLLFSTSVLIGELGCRHIDNTHSDQYNQLLNVYKEDLPRKRIDYEKKQMQMKLKVSSDE